MERYYQTADYFKLFVYFFEVYRIAFTKGVATEEFADAAKRFPLLEGDDGIVSEYNQKGMSLLRKGYAPSVISLFLKRMLVEQCRRSATAEQIHMMDLSRCLIQSLHVSELRTILDMSCFWNDAIVQYAKEHFYPECLKKFKKNT